MDQIFERLALVYVVLAAVVAMLPARRARRLGAVGLVFLALGAAADEVGGAGVAPGSFTTVNEILAVAGILVVIASLAWMIRGKNGVPVSRAAPRSSAGHPGPDVFLLGGLALAAGAPHLIWIGMGVLLGLAATVRGAVRAQARLWLAVLVVGAGLLGFWLILVITILGPLGGAVGVLPAGPFSPAAERLLVLLPGSATLLLSGLAPLTRAPWRLALAPFGALLLARVIAPGFPQGMAEWRPLAELVLALMLGTAALTRRWAAAAVCGGLAALWTGDPQAVTPGIVLVFSGWMADQGEVLRAERGISLSPKWSGIPLIVPALAALPALVSVLRVEVLLPTLAVLAVAIGLALDSPGRASR